MEYYETTEEPSFWPAFAHQRPPGGFAQFDATSAAVAGLDGADARLHPHCHHNSSLDNGGGGKDLHFDDDEVDSSLDSGGKEWEGRRFALPGGVHGTGVHGVGVHNTSLGSPGGSSTALCQRKLAVVRQAMWKAPQRLPPQLQISQTSNGSSIGSGSASQSLASSFDYSRADSDDSVNDSGVELKGAPIRPGALGQGSLTGDPRWSGDMCVERQAQAYRSAASGATAAAVWSGTLPPRNTKGSAFSCKVFLGGVPWDITENDLQCAFGRFGNPKIEWPAAHDSSSRNVKGHLYLIFDTEKSVKQLLGSCNYDFNQGHHNWYYKVASKRMRVKEVQVIPWQLADASYVRNGCMTTFGTKTVFVGSLHGMLTAEGLAKVLDDLFGGVVAATIDTDKYKYPIGSGRVTFNSNDSYMKALRAVFVDLRTPKFNKKIQIDPFLEDSACSICSTQLGPYFCRDLQCFSYFCHACWQWQHSASNIGHHIPLMRNPRS